MLGGLRILFFDLHNKSRREPGQLCFTCTVASGDALRVAPG
ncbi:hypothetical protein PS712_02128 [Pseudomonas fluorescens]|uniref:Uncharacterized protein n=1 Tax=Pseudomonas fluorescens TaxID=294 RepID=A0A5E7CF29_PSEFL|nr:hypothetical protein PS712_02128 [Pseudomonas fluorescens]